MRVNYPQVCLFQPEIPQNTGTIGRLVAATQSRLHLVRPFGFSTEDKNLRRAGLDYWPYLDLEIHDSIQPLLDLFPTKKIAFFSKYGEKPYTQMDCEKDLLVFGRETSGLPDDLWNRYEECFYQIPMFHSEVRSLNLANSVSIVLYDQLHRRGLF
ncbi:MAG: tRNA (cytidine(34)-2'-O)-methyltransferase [Oligoflexales bacterium]|nr:tRNA (cytidine(34)-2'-O)-methyltransferase [Oligoflexales bacterium]